MQNTWHLRQERHKKAEVTVKCHISFDNGSISGEYISDGIEAPQAGENSKKAA